MPKFDSKILEDVFNNHLATIKKPEDRKLFESAFDNVTSLDDILTTIEKKQATSTAKKSSRLLNKLNNLLEFIRENSGVLETLSQINGLFGCSIWGPLKLIVTVLYKSQEAVEKLTRLVQTLSVNARFCKAYEKLHGGDQNVKDCLRMFYEDIVRFAAIAVGYFGKSNGKHFFRHFVKPATAQFDVVIEDLKEHGEAVKTASNIAQMENTQQFQQQTLEHQKEMKEGKVENKKKKVRQWLNPGHSYKEQQNLQSSERTDKTCEWFLSHPNFQSWSDPVNEKKKLLWLHGKPGCGKSYLASAAVSSLEKNTKPIYYFYNQKEPREEFHQSAIGFLGAFLFQLFETNSDAVRDTITTSWTKAPENTDKASSFDYLQNLLEECIPQIDGKVLCVLDALDECKNPKPLMDCIVKTVGNSDKIKFFVTSRDEAKIRSQFEHTAIEISVKNENVEADIKRYLEDKIDAWEAEKKHKSGILSEIDQLVLRSEGMFLWARLMMDVLAPISIPAEIKKILSQTPSGLDGMYEFIFSRIKQNTDGSPWMLRLSQGVLKWCTSAKAPVTAEQLRVALAVHPEDTDFDEDKMVLGGHFRQTLSDACGPLVQVMPDKTVQVVHLTVKEFIFTEGGGEHSEWAFTKEGVDEELGLTSLRFLLYDRYLLANTMKPGMEQKDLEKASAIPDIFFAYAVRYWHVHAIDAVGSLDLHTLAERYINSEQSYLWYMSLWNHSPYAEWKDIDFRLSKWSSSVTEGKSAPLAGAIARVIKRQYEAFIAKGIQNEYSYISMLGMAEVHCQKEEYQEAAAVQRKILNMCISNPKCGPDDINTAFPMVKLAETLTWLNEYEEAQELQLKALEIQIRVNGEDDDDTLLTIANISALYRKQNRDDLADKYDALALAGIQKRSENSESASTAAATHVLAENYLFNNKYDQAAELYEKVLEIRTKCYGIDNAETQKTMRDLSHCYFMMDEIEKREKLDRDALRLFKEKYGDEHPQTLSCMEDLADLCTDVASSDNASMSTQVEYMQEAKDLLLHVVDKRRILNGETDKETLSAMADLANVYRTLGNSYLKGEDAASHLREAETLQLFVLETRQAQLGNTHHDTLIAMTHLAWTYESGGAWDGVEELHRHVHKARTAELGAYHEDTKYSRDQLVTALRMQGRDAEGEAILKESRFSTLKKVFQKSRPSAIQAKDKSEPVIARWKRGNSLRTLSTEEIIAC